MISNLSFTQNVLRDRQAELSIGENFRIYPSNVSQTEVFIESHPSNPNVIFSSANTINFNPFFISEGIYVSSDGGETWRGNDTCTGELIQFHGGDPGITIDKDGTFILTRKGSGPFTGLYSHYSTDLGLTWSRQLEILIDDLERATLTSDANLSSNYYGRTYAVWVKFSIPHVVMSAYTTNNGQSWSDTIRINNPPLNRRSAGGEIATGLNGYVYSCWAGITDVSPFTEDFVGVAYSSNGGASWNVDENAFDMNGIAGVLTDKANIRVNGLPSIAIDTSGGLRNGWIYIVTTQKNLTPAGSDPDIIMNRSTDGGISWSAGIRVNQDQSNNGAIQYFPAVHVDKYGGLNILFYDDRNTTSDSTGVFLGRSDDGGNNWREFEISDHNFKPVPIGGLGTGYQGDNISLTTLGDKIIPVWMDNSTGTYQIWTAIIDIATVGINETENSYVSFKLEQNYPNPFNPATKIKFSIPFDERRETQKVTLRVYDVLGNLISTLVNEEKSAGDYTVNFNANNLRSGIYYYQLRAGSFVKTKSMVLLK